MVALWVAMAALVSKELLFRYMLAVAKRVKSSMLVANAWHARSDAASSLVVALGIIGNLAGYPILDPIARHRGLHGHQNGMGASAGMRCTT
jgi:divalent metal cation (Fe/Co/Zn/Cd) transporter